MRLTKITLLLASSLAWNCAQASFVDNGNFDTCNFSGWQTDSDGETGNAADFTINETSDGCSATIFIDRTATFANTLYQNIDFTADATSQLTLRYDFYVDSELTDQAPFTADYFTIGFGDGSGLLFNAEGEPGSLFGQPDINGPMNYQGEIMLNTAFTNQQGWTLDIQLLSNFDLAPAFMTINHFSIEAIDNPLSVPAPATLPLLLCAFGFLGRRINNKGPQQ